MGNRLYFYSTVGVAFILLLYTLSYFSPFYIDDAFISLRYVDRFLQGKGLTWNDGEVVEGYSNFLWVMLTALLGAAGVELVLATKILGGITTIATFVLLVWHLRKNPAAPLAVLLGLSAFASCASVAIWSMSGMETSLMMMLLTWATIVARRLIDKEDYDTAVWVGILLGLLCMTRPEGVIFTFFFASGLLIFSELPKLRRVKIIALMCAVSWVIFGAHLAFRLSYYHQWTANSALAKASLSYSHVIEGVFYAGSAMTSFLPVFLYSLFTTRLCISRVARFNGILGIIILGYTVSIITAGGDTFEAYRFFVPLVPLFALWAVNCANAAMQSGRKVLEVALLLVVLSGQVFLQYQYPAHNVRNSHILMELWSKMGMALKERFGDTRPLTLFMAAGASPYYSELPAIDGFGLNDAYMTKHRYDPELGFGAGRIGHELFNVEYIKSRRPDVLVLETPMFGMWCDFDDCKDLLDNYVSEELDAGGNNMKFRVFIRKDSTKAKLRERQ